MADLIEKFLQAEEALKSMGETQTEIVNIISKIHSLDEIVVTTTLHISTLARLNYAGSIVVSETLPYLKRQTLQEKASAYFNSENILDDAASDYESDTKFFGAKKKTDNKKKSGVSDSELLRAKKKTDNDKEAAEKCNLIFLEQDDYDTELPKRKKKKLAPSFFCTTCGRGFGSDSSLERHTVAKHGGLYKCRKCKKKGFSSQMARKQHAAAKHGGSY